MICKWSWSRLRQKSNEITAIPMLLDMLALPKFTWLRDRNPWPGLREAAVIRSTRTNLSTGEVSESMRYFIYSHPEMTAEGFLRMQRKHWRIENNLHWTLDCVFHEDDIHIRMGHAAQVLNIIRKLCMQMLKMDTSWKGYLVAKRQRCAWSFDYAQSVLKNWVKIGVDS